MHLSSPFRSVCNPNDATCRTGPPRSRLQRLFGKPGRPAAGAQDYALQSANWRSPRAPPSLHSTPRNDCKPPASHSWKAHSWLVASARSSSQDSCTYGSSEEVAGPYGTLVRAAKLSQLSERNERGISLRQAGGCAS